MYQTGTLEITMAKITEPEWAKLSILNKDDGKYYQCEYCVENKIITVRTSKDSKSTQIGNSPSYVLASLLLRELIEAGTADEHTS